MACHVTHQCHINSMNGDPWDERDLMLSCHTKNSLWEGEIATGNPNGWSSIKFWIWRSNWSRNAHVKSLDSHKILWHPIFPRDNFVGKVIQSAYWKGYPKIHTLMEIVQKCRSNKIVGCWVSGSKMRKR